MRTCAFPNNTRASGNLFRLCLTLSVCGFVIGLMPEAARGQTSAPPRIVVQPQSQTVSAGDTVMFHVEATGTPPLGYRWRRDGITVVGFGQGTDTLIITNVPQSFHSNRFSVIVTNSANPIGVLSSNALLIVLSSSNDPPQIGRQPLSQTVAVGGTAVFSVVAAGAPPLSYQWLFNDGELAGKITPSLVLTNVQPSRAGNYSVRVSNPFGSTTSSNASLTVVEPPTEPPAITTQPQSQIALPGWDVMFSVHATGTPPLSYRWRRNGVTLAGETNFMLTVNDVTEANAGAYTVVVSNAFGMVISTPAALTVETNFGPNIVVNGVFNDLSPAGIPGWVVNGEWFRSSDAMGEGWIGLSSGTDVYQDLPTTPGQTYLLSFDARGFPGFFSGETQLGIHWGDQSLGVLTLPNTNWFWARHTFRVLAAGEPTRLRFRNVGPDSFVKPSLDNVSVVALAPGDDPDPDPSEMVQDLILVVDQANLGSRNKRPLVATLKSVATALERGQLTVAVRHLQAFQHKIYAQVGDPVLVEMWTAAAQEIIDALPPP